MLVQHFLTIGPIESLNVGVLDRLSSLSGEAVALVVLVAADIDDAVALAENLGTICHFLASRNTRLMREEQITSR